MRNIFRRFFFKVRRFLSLRPAVFNFIYSIKPHYRNNLLVKSKTDLVIEGYPRSANTHCAVVVEKKIPSLKVAHHMHSEAQILRAFGLDIPVIVVIREPVNSVSSMVLRERFLTIKDCLIYYIEFYSFLVEHKNSVVFLKFDDVLSSNDVLISAVSVLVGIEVNGDSGAVEGYSDYITELNNKDGGDNFSVSLPSKEKENEKSKIVNEINNDSRLKSLLSKAQLLYEDVNRKA